jgi:calcineurin-like phosphoesterase family protein
VNQNAAGRVANVWFTADQHFGHANIIRHCSRPFGHVDAMDEAMIANWNCVVRPGDTVYHLGDFAFRSFTSVKSLLGLLSGQIHLIRGNHDREKDCRHFVTSQDYLELKHDGQLFVLSHYPFETWRGSNKDSIHLHGHCHGRLDRRPRRYDVGVDANDFTPVSLEQILDRR